MCEIELVYLKGDNKLIRGMSWHYVPLLWSLMISKFLFLFFRCREYSDFGTHPFSVNKVCSLREFCFQCLKLLSCKSCLVNLTFNITKIDADKSNLHVLCIY